MIQCKIFYFYPACAVELEPRVNFWIADHPEYEILSMQHTYISEKNQAVFITYRAKEGTEE